MKLFGLSGYATGKKGDSIFTIKHGVQIVRQYNPSPANPNTPGQVASRARMKLIALVGKQMKDMIAIQREGLKSGYNEFVSKNYDLTSYANQEAQIALQDVQLTKGGLSLPSFTAERSGDTISVELVSGVVGNIDKVVYSILSCPSNQELIPAGSVVARAAGADGTFPATLPNVEGDICIYAYGIKENSELARVKFSNLGVDPGLTVAKIIATNQLSVTDYESTNTRGLQLSSGESSGETPGTNAVRVTLGNVQGTSATNTGAGNYEVGASVTVRSSYSGGEPDSSFLGWYSSQSDPTTENRVSQANPYTFTAAENIALYARWS